MSKKVNKLDRAIKLIDENNISINSCFSPSDLKLFGGDLVSYIVSQLRNKEGNANSSQFVLPCKVGDTIYLRACCECISTSFDMNTGSGECPFEADCLFSECENGNERTIQTTIKSIWNDGNGWYFSADGLNIDIPLSDIGKSVFLTPAEFLGREE